MLCQQQQAARFPVSVIDRPGPGGIKRHVPIYIYKPYDSSFFILDYYPNV